MVLRREGSTGPGGAAHGSRDEHGTRDYPRVEGSWGLVAVSSSLIRVDRSLRSWLGNDLTLTVYNC